MFFSLTYNHKWQSRGSGQGFRSPPQHKYGGAEPPTFWYGKTLLRRYFTIPVTSATSKRTKAHIFSPQTTQELPKKHHEAGPPKQLTTDTLGTVRIAKRFAFWKFWVRVCVWLSWRWVPPNPPPPPLTFQNAPPSLLMNMIIISTATIISLFKLLPITYLRIHLIILLTYVY